MTLEHEDHTVNFNCLEQIEIITNIIKSEKDVEKLLWNICEKILAIFKCDRAWLLFPCDPESPTWQVPIERTTSKYPGANLKNTHIKMTPDVAAIFQQALDSDTPVVYGKGGLPLAENTKSFAVRSQLSMAIYPRQGKPWQFGLHQCSSERVWTEAEIKLFNIIGVMTGEALGNLLLFRDLKKINAELEQRVADRTNELQKSLDEVKTLRGIIPICSYCKKIRNDAGAWNILEAYICAHSDAQFSHGICPECYTKQVDEIAQEFK